MQRGILGAAARGQGRQTLAVFDQARNIFQHKGYGVQYVSLPSNMRVRQVKQSGR